MANSITHIKRDRRGQAVNYEPQSISRRYHHKRIQYSD